VLTSSGGAGTTFKTTPYKRTDMAGARVLGGGASPAFDAGKTTPRITPPTGAGLVPGWPPCSPGWSKDAGATLSDPDEDMLVLVRDALTLSLALVRDALTFCLRPPPTPDLLHGKRWELGMVGLVMCPTGIRCATVERDNGGGLTCGLSLTEARTLLFALTPDNEPTMTRPPSSPQGPRTRGVPVGLETGAGVVRAPTPPHETFGTPKGVDMAPVGEPPGLARDRPR